jgi:hypothetical protein
LTDEECVALVTGVLDGTKTVQYPMFFSTVFMRYNSIKKKQSLEVHHDQSALFETHQVKVEVERSATKLTLSQPHLNILSNEDCADANYHPIVPEDVNDTTKVINVTAGYNTLPNQRHIKRAVVAKIASSLVKEQDGIVTPIKLVQTSPIIEPYSNTDSLKVVQNVIMNEISKKPKGVSIYNHYVSVPTKKFNDVLTNIQTPKRMAVRDANKNRLTLESQPYIPHVVACHAPPRTVKDKDLVSEISVSRRVASGKGFATIINSSLHGLNLNRPMNKLFNRMVDTVIPENVSVIYVRGANRQYCQALRNKLIRQNILIIEAGTDAIDYNHGALSWEGGKLVKVKHTILISGTIPDTELGVLHLDFSTPDQCNVAKKTVVYVDDVSKARAKFIRSVERRSASKQYFQFYVNPLAIEDTDSNLLPSSFFTQGYVLYRSWDTGIKPSYILRITVVATRYALMFPYHRVPRQKYPFITDDGQRQNYMFHLPVIDARVDFKEVIDSAVGS